MRSFKHLIPTAAVFTLAASAAFADEVVKRGEFVGKSRHETRGEATIEKDGDKWVIRFGDDFFHDGAPDPKVALGRNGFRKDLILAPLGKLEGAQSYDLPPGADPDAYNEVWIWCEQYNVPLGQATLN